MINLLDLFDAVYVINLRERTDRRRQMDKVLSGLGLSFEHDRVHLFPAFKVAEAHGFPSPGVRGCFLSHKAIFEQAQKAGYNRVLILEDDVEFSRHSLKLLETLPEIVNQSLPDGFFYFGFSDPNGKVPYANKHTESLELETRPGRVVCAHAYSVSADIYERLIAHLDECLEGQPGDTEIGPMDVDGAFNSFRRRYPDIKATVITPQLAWQRVTHSDLHAKGWHGLPGVRWLMKPLRWVKNNVNVLRR